MTLQEEQYVRTILSLVSTMIARIPHPVAIEGILASGSYNPQNSSAMSVRGDTFSSLIAEEQLTHRNISIATAAHGDQYGPVGDERTILIPTQSGYVMLFEHNEDDSPGAPSGWRYINVPYGLRLKTTNGVTIQIDDTTGFAQIGAIGLNATQDAICTQRYVQTAINNLRSETQTAITTLAGAVAGGSGVGPPTIGSVVVTGSSVAKAAP